MAFAAPIITAALLISMMSAPASAHRLGGQFRHTQGTWLYLPYYTGFSTNLWAYPHVRNAGSNWYYTNTKLVPYRSTNWATTKVDFYAVDWNTNWWGLAQPKPCNTCTYGYSVVYLNWRTMKHESSHTRTKVATHEFGHAFGLAHANTWGSWFYNSVMKQGRLSYNRPQAHDVSDTNAIYRR